MITDIKEIENSALNLDKKEKARLADKLWLSVHGEIDSEIEQAWAKEIERRKKSIETGEAILLDGFEVLEKAKKRLKK